MIINSINPYNIGWLESKLNDQDINILWDYIDRSKKQNNICDNNIPSNILLSDENNYFFDNVIKNFLGEYSRVFENIGNSCGITHYHNYCLSSMWVNFQKENDFNPLHNHNSLYSFVVFMKIPTEWQEQHNIKKTMATEVGNTPKCSDFEFIYNDILGRLKIHTYLMDSSMEGTMLFFPSKLGHMVYPFFNSSEYRISISGNVSLNTSFTLNQ